MRPVLHSYALRDYPLEHVLRVAAADGWPAIELSSWHFDPEFDADNIRTGIATAVRIGRRYGVEVFCADYWAVFTAADERERAMWVEKACLVVDACADNGITLVNGAGGWLVRDGTDWDRDWAGNGSALASDVQRGWVADCYHRVAAHAAERGVRVAVEVHPNTVHDTVAATAHLLDLAGHDNLVVTLDPANAAALGADDRDPAVIDLVADRVAFFHLKNCLIRDGVTDFTVDAAAGVVDNYRWLARLAQMPAVTDICVEYCGDGDPHPRLVAGRRYLEDTLRLVAADRD
ncbi:sugar phosphate isomerase/epimerase family protein [Micromonospora sp. WMMD734]|uniref:Sugar phosphate isomerase/epimerase n=1 Tax=Micromonospora humidisoli TaxID=2807622 RepID=A0ABS2JJ29_9ACTN|nr:sugar phosphate isomerase/epimerase [Micromonospora humidisoli]MBM7086537.1 sugar phosphate isomerase/epimerase [Micromonospora humidisoli]